jgi:hypothetical protein
MTEHVKRHPHAYTLQLFRLAIKHLPPRFDAARAEYYRKRLEEFEADYDMSYEEIRLTITQLGRESWPERQAYQEMYARYGRSSEEAFLLKNLDKGLRAKFEKFIEDGGKINYLERESAVRSERELLAPMPFESYFDPEEKFAIVQALLTARDAARKEIVSLIETGKREEYEQMIQNYRQREASIDRKIKELEQLASTSDRWQESIVDRVRVLEEGWSVMERGVDEEKLDREIEYWRGTLASFLQA